MSLRAAMRSSLVYGRTTKAFFDENASGFDELLRVREKSLLVADDFELDPIGETDFTRETRGADGFVGGVAGGGVRQDEDLLAIDVASSDSLLRSVRLTRRNRYGEPCPRRKRRARAPSPESCGTSLFRRFRRELNARPAMTRLSGIGDLKRILDPQRPANKSQVYPGDPRIRSYPRSLLDLASQLGHSVGARPHEPAQIDADTEGVAVELQWNAPAEVKLEVQITGRFVIDASIETIIAH